MPLCSISKWTVLVPIVATIACAPPPKEELVESAPQALSAADKISNAIPQDVKDLAATAKSLANVFTGDFPHVFGGLR